MKNDEFIEFDNRNNHLLIKLFGEIDNYFADEVKHMIENKITKSNVLNIELDFENVTFIDSSGVGLIIHIYKFAKTFDRKISITKVSSNINKILEISGIKEIIQIVC